MIYFVKLLLITQYFWYFYKNTKNKQSLSHHSSLKKQECEAQKLDVMMKVLLIICIVTFYHINIPLGSDPLEESYGSISKMIKESKKGSSEQTTYLAAYLKKAKKEKAWKHIVKGYKYYLHNSESQKMTVYADSMVRSALESKNNILISSAYLTKGLTYYWQKKYVDALDNYIAANNYLSKCSTGTEYLNNKLKYNIGLIKYRLGDPEAALIELEACQEYFKKKHIRPYLNTLHFISLCHRSMGNYELCSEIIEKGIQEGKSLENHAMENYFLHSKGINKYLQGDYEEAIRHLEKVNPSIEKLGDFANVTMGHLYLGLSNWKLNKINLAIPYLKLMDQSYTDHKFAKKEFQQGYNILINHYKSIGDHKNYVFYLEQRDKFKTSLMDVTTQLFPKLTKEYTLANANRKQQQNRRNINRILITLLIGGFVTFSASIGYRHYVEHYATPKNLIAVTSESSTKQKSYPNPFKPKGRNTQYDISNRKKRSILERLTKFEEDKLFLEKNINLARLASDCETNIRYLSQIIKQEKGKKFQDYLTGLRLNYIIDKIKKNKIYRRVKINHLAKECGFESPNTFTRAFKSKTGTVPTKYIQKIVDNCAKES